MKRRCTLVAPLTVMLLSTSACTGSPEDAESELGAARSALLTANALNANALNANALAASALSPNVLTPGVMAAIKDPTAAGDLSRELLQYAVGCAFDPTQSFSFSWTDGASVIHNETYWGLLVLAPDWVSQPLSSSHQRWVSACLISRVNYFGVSVIISARGPTGGLNVVDSTELSTYTMLEGAFWGNVFDPTPTAFSCHDAPNVDYARSKNRVCAAGYLEGGQIHACGIIQILGPCDVYCGALNKHYKSCRDDTGIYTNDIVTVFLD